MTPHEGRKKNPAFLLSDRPLVLPHLDVTQEHPLRQRGGWRKVGSGPGRVSERCPALKRKQAGLRNECKLKLLGEEMYLS